MIKLHQRHSDAGYLTLPIQVLLSGFTITRGLIGIENIQGSSQEIKRYQYLWAF